MKLRKPSAPSIVIILLCVMYFLTYVDRVNLSTAASTIAKEFSLSKSQLGLLLSSFGWTYALFQVFGGWVGDRMGPRKTLVICGAIWAVATAISGLAVGLVSLMLFRLVVGFGEGATFPTATRAMQNWIAPGRRGFAQGITHAFSRLGNFVTPPIVAALIIWWSWRGAFLVLGLASSVWVVIWWIYYRDDPRQHPGVTPEDLAEMPPPKTAVAQVVPWGRLIKRMAPVTLTYFCYGWSLWLFLTWLPTFFKEGQNLDLKQSALYTSAVFFAGVVGDTLGGVISDYVLHRTGRLKLARLSVIVLGMIGAAGCLIPVLFVTGLVPLTLCLAGGFFFLELVIGPIWSIPMDIAPQYSGTASGLMNTGSAVAAIVSPLAFGVILDASHNNWTLPFVGSILLLLIGSVLAFTMHPDRKFVDDRGLPPDGSAAEGRRGSIDDRGLPPDGSAAEGRRGSIDDPRR